MFDYKPHNQFAPKIDRERCKAAVPEGGRGVGFFQCQKRPGTSGYCGTHDPKAEAKRRAKREERYEQFTLGLDINAAQLAVVEAAKKLTVYTDAPEARRLQKAVERLKRLEAKRRV